LWTDCQSIDACATDFGKTILGRYIRIRKIREDLLGLGSGMDNEMNSVRLARSGAGCCGLLGCGDVCDRSLTMRLAVNMVANPASFTEFAYQIGGKFVTIFSPLSL